MVCAARGLSEMVEMFLVNGADTSLKARNGWTAQDFAEKMGATEVAEIIGNYQQSMEKKTDILEEEEELLSEEKKSVLSAYHKAFNDDENGVNHDLVLAVIKFLLIDGDHNGSILVFLPGYEDIMAVK